jgi:hypothetical protein
MYSYVTWTMLSSVMIRGVVDLDKLRLKMEPTEWSRLPAPDIEWLGSMSSKDTDEFGSFDPHALSRRLIVLAGMALARKSPASVKIGVVMWYTRHRPRPDGWLFRVRQLLIPVAWATVDNVVNSLFIGSWYGCA